MEPSGQVFVATVFPLLRKAAKLQRHGSPRDRVLNVLLLKLLEAFSSSRETERKAMDRRTEALSKARRCANPACGRLEGVIGSLRACGGCRSVLYCGVACQKQHWGGGHRAECKKGLDGP